ncbi:cardiolipin synthase [Oikeobacillus pervagus]|uniref:Cardiolipin synthase n=1 Tax=Oikeobacillus pervagus TaxID=1325931 RepID=A0AAJ1SZM6_9BACI|nr:cardiolipin synthase [Oikeobacillus pervagus]MDQ0214181.1 cardiolipin synthase [Oikeobacillus pervagus]
MIWLWTSLFIAIFLFFLIILDFRLGEKAFRQKADIRHFPPRHSDMKLYNDGPELFHDLFEDIAKAKKSVHTLFYIVKDDQFSQQFLSLLEKKAEQGVKVKLLMDWLGSYKVKKSTIRQLKKNHVDIAFTHKSRPPFFFYTLQKRNHRKITVIDHEIAYLGGFNVGKEYINQDKKLSPWRDYHIKIIGEGVHDLQQEFLLNWKNATGVDYLQEKAYFPPQPKGNIRHHFLSTEGVGLEGTFYEFISNAKYSIIIGSPYFIPSQKVFCALIDALNRGVKVTILIPKMADHLMVKEAGLSYLKKLLELNAEVYLYLNGFYHAKVYIFDDKICDVGTANFDQRSFFINDECNCLIHDEIFIQKVKHMFLVDLNNSERLTIKQLQKASYFTKFKMMIGKMIAPFL